MATATPSDSEYVARTFISACMDGEFQIDKARIAQASWGDLPDAAHTRYAAYRFQNVFRFKQHPNTFLVLYSAEAGAKGFTNICAVVSSDFSLRSLWEAVSSAEEGKEVHDTGGLHEINFISWNVDEGYISAGNEFDHKNAFVEVLHLNDAQKKCIKTGNPGVPAYLAFQADVFSGERLAGCP
jgi:hypothetical protein